MAKCPKCGHAFSVAEAYNKEAKRTFDIHEFDSVTYLRNKNGLVIKYGDGTKKIKWFIDLGSDKVTPLVHFKQKKSWYVKVNRKNVKIADILNEGEAKGKRIIGANNV